LSTLAYNPTLMPKLDYDVVIIGGGHAGAEAAWAASRLGAATALVTLDPDRIGQMSCNPAIGGLAKGQMVREIDALGGLMGIATDNTAIQFRMLNRSKGPAVWGPRAQADKYRYAREVQRLLRTCPNLTIISGEVADILVHDDRSVRAVQLADSTLLACRAVIVTTGTFLRALMHTGPKQTPGGRVGEASANHLSTCLTRLGLELGRLKTGTPPRLLRQSIDFAILQPQPGDTEPQPFSFLNEYSPTPFVPPLTQVQCHLTATNPAVHAIIRDNIHLAPMYTGQIKSIGPRYCPSIEDKVVRFADKTQHHIFLEPEGLDTDEIYCNGISTSLPTQVQTAILPLIPGLEHATILRFGYAVEYDMVWPSQINSTLQTKLIAGLFLAGQINGTSGYEEAAAQGLVAGINAARLVAGKGVDFVLRRDQAYIGVLIDDLVTKPPTEPYRMFTSRAEHRLHLRCDNADQRLTPIGRDIGLVDDARHAAFQSRTESIEQATQSVLAGRIDGTPAIDLLRRPDRTWQDIAGRDPTLAAIPPAIGRQVEIRAKYEGYITRQTRQIDQMAKMETKLIPPTIDYKKVPGLRNEARQKLTQLTPRSLGQALRISGITPADITLIAIHLTRAT
jgi:tRNA uridine 5-carboxymethylaminomethyl modification enzyme